MTLSPIILTLLGLLLACISALVSGGIAWGAFKVQLDTLAKALEATEKRVERLTDAINTLSVRLAVFDERHSAAGNTGKHGTA